MKKIGLIAFGIALVTALSGCLIVAVPPAISNITFASSWILKPSNTYIIYDPQTTQVGYAFNYDNLNEVQSWTETWTGEATPQFNFTQTLNPSSGTKTEPITGSSVTVRVDQPSKTITVIRTFGPNTSPFSVEASGGGSTNVGPESIIVIPNPTPIQCAQTNNGTARLSIRFNITDGSSPTAVATFPVYKNNDGCTF